MVAAVMTANMSSITAQCSLRTQSRPAFGARSAPLRPRVMRAIRAESEKIDELQGIPIKDKGQVDSYQRIEAPVRGGEGAPGKIPDGGRPVTERQNELDKMLIQNDQKQEREILGTAVAFPDAMRFKGAAPEVINSRLAMLGFVAAVAAEFATGRPVSQQVAVAPVPIAVTFAIFIVASLIPILKGVPRKGGKDWPFGIAAFTPDAEIVLGRTAMLGFLGLVITEAIKQSPVF